MQRFLILLNMTMVGNMVLAVAVIASAAGTVAELQFRVGGIGAAADSAAVRIAGFCLAGLPGLGIELDDLGPMRCRFNRFPAEEPANLPPPGQRNHVQHILAEEQEVVSQGNDTEEIIGEGKRYQIYKHDHQVHQREQPGFHRDDEEQQELCIREHGGVAEEQTQIQIRHAGGTAEEHAVHIHH